MISCVVCGKVVSEAAVQYCQNIGEKPHCHKCQQARGLNRYEVKQALTKEQKIKLYTEKLNEAIQKLNTVNNGSNTYKLSSTIFNNVKELNKLGINNPIDTELIKTLENNLKQYEAEYKQEQEKEIAEINEYKRKDKLPYLTKKEWETFKKAVKKDIQHVINLFITKYPNHTQWEGKTVITEELIQKRAEVIKHNIFLDRELNNDDEKEMKEFIKNNVPAIWIGEWQDSDKIYNICLSNNLEWNHDLWINEEWKIVKR